jgi:fused signal recognition particle receptor
MFGNLKDKLKKWVSKTKEDVEEVVETIEEKIKPEKKDKKPAKKEKKVKKKETKEKKVEEKPEIIEEETPEPEVKKSKKSVFRKSLTGEKFEEVFEELEMILLQNNIAYEAVESLKESLKEKLVGESAKISIEDALKESIEELLQNPPNLIDQIEEKKESPYVILFTGINGSGKTTTIAKLANLLIKNKLTVCLASADTFRAAAIEQLQVHADKLDVQLIKKAYGSDPAAVGFDAVKYAKKNKIDVVLIDTAGRMNNRDTLMKEIEKIARVNSPDLKIFLGESITGNDATTQAKDFNDAIGIDGIILSKADVDEKGGTAVSVSHVTNKPIYFLGTGQTYDDLEVFDKEKLIKQIFE